MSREQPEGMLPLVSIGIPTYQRPRTLRRALDSAQQQTYANIEIVISDNASLDETEVICRAAAAEDVRIRYLRSPDNVGPTANFNRLFAECQGEYVLMLADDDWIASDYVARCVDELRVRPQAAMVAGRARYERDGAFVHDGVPHEHAQATAEARIVRYLRTVADNGVFYGVVPRRVLALAAPMPNVLGNDWLHVARIACQGSVHMLGDVRIHRELDGTSTDVGSILTTFGEAEWQARIPSLVIAWEVFSDIAWRHPVYGRLGRQRRVWVGAVAAIASIRWKSLAWHLVTPTLARIGRRPRGERLYRMYDRFTRRLGAGRTP